MTAASNPTLEKARAIRLLIGRAFSGEYTEPRLVAVRKGLSYVCVRHDAKRWECGACIRDMLEEIPRKGDYRDPIALVGPDGPCRRCGANIVEWNGIAPEGVFEPKKPRSRCVNAPKDGNRQAEKRADTVRERLRELARIQAGKSQERKRYVASSWGYRGEIDDWCGDLTEG